LGIDFYIPDTFFKEIKELGPVFNGAIEGPFATMKGFGFDFDSISSSLEQEVLMLIGPPASGKSRFANNFVKKFPNYIIVSKDLYKTQFDAMFSKFWKEGRSIILDNTHATKESRNLPEYIKRANGSSTNQRAIFFNLPKKVVFHLNSYRAITTDKNIPAIAIHSYYKKLEIPVFDDFQELYIVNDILIDHENKLLNSFLPLPKGQE